MTDLRENVAVIGAGTMGAGIAQKYATHGYQVFLVDKNVNSLEAAKNSIAATLNQGVNRGLFSHEQAQGILAKLTFSTDLKGCRSALLVIEAIWEDLLAKRALFLELESNCSSNAIFATNTSSFLIKDIQTELKYPERVVGLHYFYHPAKNRLVELVKSPLTKEACIAQVQQLQRSINKIVIFSADSPGFIVNRFFVPWLNEAMKIVHEGHTNIATVEQAAKQFFNIPMGPFELMNITGLPITLHACHSMAQSLGSFYAPCPVITNQLEKKMAFDLTGPVDEWKFSEISMRLLDVVCSISGKMVHEERVCTEACADIGAKVGLLWAKGPFELAREHRWSAHKKLVAAT